MLANISFELPEDEESFKIALMADKMHSALWDLQELFMRKYKYEDPKSEERREEFEELRSQFFQLLSDHDIFL